MSYVILKTLLLPFFENKMGANWLNLLCEPTSTPFFTPFKFQIKCKLSKSLTSKFNKLHHFHYGFRYGKLQFVTLFGYIRLFVGYTKKS